MKMSLKNNYSLSVKLNNSVIKETPPLEDIVIHPQTEEVTYKSQQYGFDNVTVTGVNLGEKTVVPTTEEQVILPEENELDLSKVNVAGDENLVPENIRKDVSIFGVDGEFEGESEYNAIIKTENMTEPTGQMQNLISSNITKVPSYNILGFFNAGYLFYSCVNLEEIPTLNLPYATTITCIFYGCSKLKKMPKINAGTGLKNLSYMFYSCSNLTDVTELENLNTSEVTNTENMFKYCRKLEEVPLFDTSKVTSMSNIFDTCSILKSIPQFNTQNVTNMYRMFYGAYSIVTIPELNAEKVINIAQMFNFSNGKLKDFGGLKDLGKAYLTTASANYSNYTLALNNCNQLTHDSLMNVINNLYDIASIGVKQQTLNLGTTNKNKLTADEIAIATNKGWNVT